MPGNRIEDPMKEFLKRNAADTLLSRQRLLDSLPTDQRRVMEQRFRTADAGSKYPEKVIPE